MTVPAISVIVPLYNKESLVGSTLEALSRQLLANDEIIIVDDGSTDRSGQIAQRYAGEHVRVVRSHENAGPASARNWGAELASGEFLLFFDADDEPAPDLLPTLRRAIGEFPAEAMFCFGIAYGAHGERFRLDRNAADTVSGKSPTILPIDAFAHFALAGRPLCTASSTCVRRSAFVAAGGFMAGLRYCEDPELWARLSAQHRIVQIRATLANYTDVPQSLSQLKRVEVGAVEPYVRTLKNLAGSGRRVYALLALTMLKRNIVFGRANGAKSREVHRFIERNRDGLPSPSVLMLHLVGSLPAVVLRLLLHSRNWILRCTATLRIRNAH